MRRPKISAGTARIQVRIWKQPDDSSYKHTRSKRDLKEAYEDEDKAWWSNFDTKLTV